MQITQLKNLHLRVYVAYGNVVTPHKSEGAPTSLRNRSPPSSGSNSKPCTFALSPASVGYLVGLIFNLENGSDIFSKRQDLSELLGARLQKAIIFTLTVMQPVKRFLAYSTVEISSGHFLPSACKSLPLC
jgi:hypothetical protein